MDLSEGKKHHMLKIANKEISGMRFMGIKIGMQSSSCRANAEYKPQLAQVKVLHLTQYRMCPNSGSVSFKVHIPRGGYIIMLHKAKDCPNSLRVKTLHTPNVHFFFLGTLNAYYYWPISTRCARQYPRMLSMLLLLLLRQNCIDKALASTGSVNVSNQISHQ